MKILIIFCLISTFVGCLLSALALLTPNWIERYEQHKLTLNFGLFELCDEFECRKEDYLLEKSGIQGTLGVLVVSLSFFLVSVGLLAMELEKKNKTFLIFSGLCCILASSAAFSGVIIYTVMSYQQVSRSDIFFHGYSFGLAWTAGVVGLIEGIVSVIFGCTRKISKQDTNKKCASIMPMLPNTVD